MKAAGLLDIDLRLKLTPQQKAKITRKYNQFSDVVNHPENYRRVSVSNKTAKVLDIDIFRKKTGKKTSLLIPVEEGSSLRISRDGIFPVAVIDHGTHIERVYPGGYKFFEVAEHVFKDSDQYRPDRYITARIGNNRHFTRAVFNEKNALYNYLQAWQPKDKKWLERKGELIAHFAVVTLKGKKEGYDPDVDTDEDFSMGEWNMPEKSRKRKRRAKKSKRSSAGRNRRRNRPF